jgi:hypothetical protein
VGNVSTFDKLAFDLSGVIRRKAEKQEKQKAEKQKSREAGKGKKQ